jgi:GT2 family glycosyltransferase
VEIPLQVGERALFEVIERIDMPVNVGYGLGHNAALAKGCGDFHLVLNPDVEMAPDALLRGIAWLHEHPDAAGVVPEGRDASGAPLYLAKGEATAFVLLLRAFAPLPLRRLFSGALAEYELHDVCARAAPAPVQLASGCFMLLRGSALTAIGGFSPDFFLYFEDFDLSRRISARGPLIYLPTMQIVHYGGAAARKGWRHILLFMRSALRYFSRWGWRLC